MNGICFMYFVKSIFYVIISIFYPSTRSRKNIKRSCKIEREQKTYKQYGITLQKLIDNLQKVIDNNKLSNDT